MTGVLRRWVMHCTAWCARRLCRRKSPSHSPPSNCRMLKMSKLKDHWKLVLVDAVGSFLLPAQPPTRGWKMLRPSGAGVDLLQCARVSIGRVEPSDVGVRVYFSRPTVLVLAEISLDWGVPPPLKIYPGCGSLSACSTGEWHQGTVS